MVNFHDREQRIKVRVPNDAFVYLGMDERPKATATDLLRGEKMPLALTADGTIELTLQAWKGVILKIR